MTNTEHLIENALMSMQRARNERVDVYEAFQDEMKLKCNQMMLKEVSITKQELWEIAQYVMCTHDVYIKSDLEAEMEERYGYRLDQRDYLY